MREIVTQKQARSLLRLPFCYVCDQPFTDSDPSTHDHVPPKKIFLKEDRNWPLILPAHEKCNAEYSFADEQAKGLIALLHPSNTGATPLKTTKVGIVKRNGKPTGVLLEGLRLRRIVAKILRACHAALYSEFLSNEDTSLAIKLPVPTFDLKTGKPEKYEGLPQHPMFCKILKDNRRISNVDQIRAYNDKFQFEVVWVTADDGETHFGIFAMNIYDWHNLANEMLESPQGCFGMYRLSKSPIPDNACVATSLELPYKYLEPLNPFEE